jgi:hypothetical protein
MSSPRLLTLFYFAARFGIEITSKKENEEESKRRAELNVKSLGQCTESESIKAKRLAF